MRVPLRRAPSSRSHRILLRPKLNLFPFLAWRVHITPATLRADMAAAVVSALLVLPQGVAFSTLAGLPPQYGLYAAMVPAIVGALWGSSWHLVSGPTNATSLMVFASLSALALPFSEDYVRLALTLNLMLGVTKLALGVARLGALTNFVSQTVIVGFTAGAGVLIVGAQLRNFFGIALPTSPSFGAGLVDVVTHLKAANPWAVAVGLATLLIAFVSRRLSHRAPHLLLGLIGGSVLGTWLNRAGIAHLATVGALPSALPPLSLPDFDPRTWSALAPACLALTLIGLTEAISSARAVALRSGQRLNANQEFIGQGLANITGAFTSSYPSSGSFNRTGANYEAGARTPVAAVLSAFVLAAVLFLIGPLATYIPLAAMAGLLFLVAAGLIDLPTMRRIVRTSRGETLVLAITFIATLAVQLDFALLFGVLASLLVYLNRTTRPHLTPVWPVRDASGSRLSERAHADYPRDDLLILRVDGSLFFGAVDHVRDLLHGFRSGVGARRRVLLVGSGMNFIDVAGADMLVQEAQLAEASGGVLYLCSLKPRVRELLQHGGYLEAFGRERVFETEVDALRVLLPEQSMSAGDPRPTTEAET